MGAGVVRDAARADDRGAPGTVRAGRRFLPAGPRRSHAPGGAADRADQAGHADRRERRGLVHRPRRDRGASGGADLDGHRRPRHRAGCDPASRSRRALPSHPQAGSAEQAKSGRAGAGEPAASASLDAGRATAGLCAHRDVRRNASRGFGRDAGPGNAGGAVLSHTAVEAISVGDLRLDATHGRDREPRRSAPHRHGDDRRDRADHPAVRSAFFQARCDRPDGGHGQGHPGRRVRAVLPAARRPPDRPAARRRSAGALAPAGRQFCRAERFRSASGVERAGAGVHPQADAPSCARISATRWDGART